MYVSNCITCESVSPQSKELDENVLIPLTFEVVLRHNHVTNAARTEIKITNFYGAVTKKSSTKYYANSGFDALHLPVI